MGIAVDVVESLELERVSLAKFGSVVTLDVCEFEPYILDMIFKSSSPDPPNLGLAMSGLQQILFKKNQHFKNNVCIIGKKIRERQKLQHTVKVSLQYLITLSRSAKLSPADANT